MSGLIFSGKAPFRGSTLMICSKEAQQRFGPNVMKLITDISCEFHNNLECSSLAPPIQLYLMFVTKYGAYPGESHSGAPL
jgi:hypothetical protein